MVFVTGGTGLVGSHLLMELASLNEPVKALYRNNLPASLAQLPNIEWVCGDLLDIITLETLLAGVTKVYHCAAIVSFKGDDKAAMIHYNTQSTTNMVNAALHCGVRKLVFVSSVAALGQAKETGSIDESQYWDQHSKKSVYGRSKFLSEMEVWRGMGEGLEVAIVNPTIILGESDWNKSSSALFKSVYNEFPWYTEGITGFVDVKDVVNAMVALMESNISGERFILSNVHLSYKDLLTKIAKGFGKTPPHKNVSKGLAAIVWRWEALKSLITGKDPLVTKETTATAMMKRHFDNSKLLQHLPRFSYADMDTTIQRICTFYAAQQKNVTM